MANFGLGRIAVLVAGAVLGLQAGGRADDALAPPPTRAPDAAPSPRSVAWEPNRGQAPEGVLAVGRGGGVTALISPRGARLLVPGGALAIEFRGAGGGRAALGRRLPGRSNYFLGSDRERWIPAVPHHASVAVRGARGAASIDWTSRGGRPAFDLALPAGTDPAAIEMRFDGADALAIASDGSLEAPVGEGKVVHSAPVAWQESAGVRTPVAARWAIRGPGRAGFQVGARNASLPLVIDPEIRFVRLLGGSGQEQALKLAFDGQGRLLLAGATASTNYPLADPIQGAYAGGTSDAFVSAVDPDDGTLLWSTYLGGARQDGCTAVASDAMGVVVAGSTVSSDFPVVNPIDGSLQFSDAQAVGAGVWEDGFVARLTAAGDALEWSTYLGGDRDRDFVTGMDFSPDGSIRLCGGSAGFTETITSPLVVGATTTLGAPKGQAFWVASLPADGSAIQWLLAVGYASSYALAGLAVAPDGDTVVVGSSWSNTYVENALQPVSASPVNYEGWVARVKPDGSGVRWATFLGGGGADYPSSVAVDAAGDVYVAGSTDSANFPVTESAFDKTYAGNRDGFVSKISADGQTLEWSSYLGGTLGEPGGPSVVVGPGNVAALVGYTGSADFPSVAPPPGVGGTGVDAFVARVSADGSQLLHCFRWGGTDSDSGLAGAIRGKNLMVGGFTRSPSLPGTSQVPGASGDLFLFEFDPRPKTVLELRASMVAATTVRLEWILANLEAEQFRVERRVEDGEFEEVGTAPAATLSFHDETVETEHRYTYRVVAIRGPDESVPSNEAVIDVTPRTPEGLIATVIHSRRVQLTWTDLAEGETGYELQREEEDGSVSTVVLTAADVESHADTTVLPDRTYTWRVRAVHPYAASGWSNDATATTPATLTVRVRRGLIVLSKGGESDRARILGEFEPLPGGDDGYDPVASGLRLVAGGWSGAVVAEVPPLDGAWRVRGSRCSWRSPRGTGPRVRVVLDTEDGTFSVRVRRATLDPEPGTPLRISLASGDLQGSTEDPWVRKGRRLRFVGGE
jgi:hypothetical protein